MASGYVQLVTKFLWYLSKVLCQIEERSIATWGEDSLFLNKLDLFIVLPLPKQYMKNYNLNDLMSQNTIKSFPVHIRRVVFSEQVQKVIVDVRDALEAGDTSPAAVESSFLTGAKRLSSWSPHYSVYTVGISENPLHFCLAPHLFFVVLFSISGNSFWDVGVHKFVFISSTFQQESKVESVSWQFIILLSKNLSKPLDISFSF